MRRLFVDLPNDQQALAVEDQFLLGSDLMIAPVYSAPVRSRARCTLHSGREWTDTATETSTVGGRTLTFGAPSEAIPVLLAEGGGLK